MEELRFILSGNDPVNNTYCRIANMVLVNEDNFFYQVEDHIRYAREQFINRYKFTPEITIEAMQNIDFIKLIENSTRLSKELIEQIKVSLIGSDSDVDKKKCTCGETSDYCTCNIIEVKVFEDPNKVKGSDSDVDKTIESKVSLTLSKLTEVKALAKDLGFQLDVDIIERKVVVARAGVTVTFSYTSLLDELQEVIDYLNGNL